MSKDNFGDRIKFFEAIETGQRFIPTLPIVVRLDGRSFSSFTRGMDKPFDVRMTRAMVDTTKALVEETGAVIGYTQSDEITLVISSDSFDSQVWFDGKKHKMISCLASLCSVVFYREIAKAFPDKVNNQIPTFDCRAFNVPSKVEAANAVLWREMDATKNAISSATRCYYSTSEMEGKNGKVKQEMLFARGVNFNDYPAFFKRGTFIQRRRTFRCFAQEEIDRLPARHEARLNPSLAIERTGVLELDMPSFVTVLNRVEVVFDGADPITLQAMDIQPDEV